MTMQEQEAALLDNLLHIFMGYEGWYMRFAERIVRLRKRFDLLGPSFEYHRASIQTYGT
jgi:hypothetical protein